MKVSLAYRIRRQAKVQWLKRTDKRFASPARILGDEPVSAAFRYGLAKRAQLSGDVLEIGPYFRPVTRSRRVSYFDVLSQDQMRERASLEGYPSGRVPFIDYVSPVADLSIIDKKFDAVLSAHCVEHQPNLIKHLQDVSNILNKGSSYYLIIPDKRYCFDFYIDESTIHDVLQANIENRKIHTKDNIVKHHAFTTHNDALQHWLGDHGDIDTGRDEKILEAVRRWEMSNGSYVDVHAWQFTPLSFYTITNYLYQQRMISLKPISVYDTPFPRNEFTAILQVT